jgi:hypothetical protein
VPHHRWIAVRAISGHGKVGAIAVDCDVLTSGDEERKVVVLTAAPDTVAETNFRLAVVSGACDPAYG